MMVAALYESLKKVKINWMKTAKETVRTWGKTKASFIKGKSLQRDCIQRMAEQKENIMTISSKGAKT